MLTTLPGGRTVKPSDIKYQWVEDLIFVDGPVLSYIRGSSQQDYFYLWMDSDWQFNRWLAIPVSRELIRGYKNRQLSLLDVIQANTHVTFVDIDDGMRVKRAFGIPVRNIPVEMLPKPESLFNPKYCPTGDAVLSDSTNYYLGLDGVWFMEDFALLQRRYEQVYAFVYTLMNLGKEAVAANIKEIFSDGQWYGGASRVNFFKDLDRAIPSMHEPRVNGMVFQSPGFIKLELWANASERLSEVAASTIYHGRDIDDLVLEINQFLRENDLRTQGTVDLLTDEARAELFSLADQLGRNLGMGEFETDFRSLVMNDPIRYSKILLSFHRRLNDILPFVRCGKLKMKVETREYRYHRIQEDLMGYNHI